MIYEYGKKDGLKGLEAEYEFNNDILYIKIQGSNYWTDYLLNFFAWPRKKQNGCRYHRVWLKDAKKFAKHLKESHQEWNIKEAYVIGHSMGGVTAAILPALMKNIHFKVSIINSPKMGNKKAVNWLNDNADVVAHYDKGDIVRFLPLLYKNYKVTYKYSNTKPFWKAHINFPPWWNAFFS